MRGVATLVTSLSRRRDTETQQLARRHPQTIKFQQSYSYGWSGSLTAPMAQVGINEAFSLSEYQQSLPDIAASMRKFLERLATPANPVIIAVDELDKVASDGGVSLPPPVPGGWPATGPGEGGPRSCRDGSRDEHCRAAARDVRRGRRAGPDQPAGPGRCGAPTQLGAGSEASVPTPYEVCPLVATPITRMSPAGMPCAFTVMVPLGERDIPVVIW